MKTNRTSRWMLVAAAAVVGSALDLTFLSGDAHAIIGRPLTPFSYAGVARRTTRRAVAVGAVAGRPYGYAAPYAAPVPVPVPAPYPAYPAPAPPPPPPSNYYW